MTTTKTTYRNEMENVVYKEEKREIENEIKIVELNIEKLLNLKETLKKSLENLKRYYNVKDDSPRD